MKENKIAGFWIRFFSRFLDIMFFSIIIIFVTYFLVEKNNGNIMFKNLFKFYLWCFLSIFILFILFILIPIFLNGQTIGMFVFRIKIFFNNDSPFLSIIKREYFFSIAWIFNLLLLMLVINYSLINKIIVNQKNIKYSSIENVRIGIFTSISSIIFFIQWIFAFSIMINKDRIGIHDKISNSKTIYKNKFIIIKKSKFLVCFKPYMVQNKKVEWVEK